MGGDLRDDCSGARAYRHIHLCGVAGTLPPAFIPMDNCGRCSAASGPGVPRCSYPATTAGWTAMHRWTCETLARGLSAATVGLLSRRCRSDGAVGRCSAHLRADAATRRTSRPEADAAPIPAGQSRSCVTLHVPSYRHTRTQAARCASTAVERHRLAPSRRPHRRAETSMVPTLVDLRRYGYQGTLLVVRTFSFAEKVGKENILVCSLTCSRLQRHVDHQPIHPPATQLLALAPTGQLPCWTPACP
jgi:hypothetical protein